MIISFPKCGRTWFTMILGRALQNFYKFSERFIICTEDLSQRIDEIPNIKIIHEGSPHLKSPLQIQKYFDKNQSNYRNVKAIILRRDIRDVFVSYFLHMKKRKKGRERYKGDISKFIRRKKGSARSFIKYYNYLERNRRIFGDVLFLDYEDLLDNGFKEVKKAFKFMGLSFIPDRIIKEAISYCSFKNMKNMEKQNRFNVKRLRPGNIKDPDSYKVRKGMKGDYINYLNKKDIDYLESNYV